MPQQLDEHRVRHRGRPVRARLRSERRERPGAREPQTLERGCEAERAPLDEEREHAPQLHARRIRDAGRCERRRHRGEAGATSFGGDRPEHVLALGGAHHDARPIRRARRGDDPQVAARRRSEQRLHRCPRPCARSGDVHTGSSGAEVDGRGSRHRAAERELDLDRAKRLLSRSPTSRSRS
jgi:hypothetical protein